ncbi:hypothetical protein [Nonomuraea africana]|uniref:Uncharacterized protein n=1 Tax=Nonomuraea africana TaxID=46171 RepID=A0ABR9KST3_9ACTN|nr:hypothetical protein [Nonomuraea africana]MBE1565097.1 hypothetical protein [Nonomuraea africana]
MEILPLDGPYQGQAVQCRRSRRAGGHHHRGVLSAPHTPTGITAEPLTGMIVADALLLAIESLDENRSVEYSHQLTGLREQLLGPRKVQ